MKTNYLLFPPLVVTMLCCSTTPPKFPDGPRIEAREILRQLQAGNHVFLEGKEIVGDLDFTTMEDSYPEGAGIWRTEVAGSLTFQKCTFKGKVGAFRKEGKKFFRPVSCATLPLWNVPSMSRWI